MARMGPSKWLCIDCGVPLGEVKGGELYPETNLSTRTHGPNLVVTCKDCGFKKVWYTADPLVRAVMQMIDAITEQSAKAMIGAMGKQIRSFERDHMPKS